jgi:2-amino-4-hydroxy-6-hydroxymethyldihydropteridine diphosphokinase
VSRPQGCYQNRTIDLDILLYGQVEIFEEGLEIPHPRLWERPFVLIPMAELGIVLPEKQNCFIIPTPDGLG